MVAHFAEITFQEVVEKCSNYGYGGDTPNGLPVCGDRRFYDVGRELEREAPHEPASVTHPDVTPLMTRGRYHKWQRLDQGFKCSVEHHHERDGVDDDDGVFCEKREPFFHKTTPALARMTSTPTACCRWVAWACAGYWARAQLRVLWDLGAGHHSSRPLSLGLR